QQFLVFLPWNFHGAESLKMRRGELCVEKNEASADQMLDQIGQADLGRIPLARKHALAEKGAPERDAVKSADKLAVMPRFDRVAMPDFEQFSVGFANWTIDPRARALAGAAGTTFDHAIEIAIELYIENALSDRFLEAFGNMEAIEGDHAAPLGTNPEDFRIVGFFGHGKYSRGVGSQE